LYITPVLERKTNQKPQQKPLLLWKRGGRGTPTRQDNSPPKHLRPSRSNRPRVRHRPEGGGGKRCPITGGAERRRRDLLPRRRAEGPAALRARNPAGEAGASARRRPPRHSPHPGAAAPPQPPFGDVPSLGCKGRSFRACARGLRWGAGPENVARRGTVPLRSIGGGAEWASPKSSLMRTLPRPLP